MKVLAASVKVYPVIHHRATEVTVLDGAVYDRHGKKMEQPVTMEAGELYFIGWVEKKRMACAAAVPLATP